MYVVHRDGAKFVERAGQTSLYPVPFSMQSFMLLFTALFYINCYCIYITNV